MVLQQTTKVAKLRLRCPTKRTNLLRTEEEKTGTWSALRSAAKHFQLISSASRKYSRSGKCLRMGCQLIASKRPSALEMAARSRRGGCHGDWSRGTVRPREAQIEGQTAAPHAASNTRVHLKHLNALCTARTKRRSEAAQECCPVQHTGIQLCSLGLSTPGESGAGHSAGLCLTQHHTHGVTGEQHPPTA